jgi:lipopolysaccharide biosynthesis regulator YciM
MEEDVLLEVIDEGDIVRERYRCSVCGIIYERSFCMKDHIDECNCCKAWFSMPCGCR